jgi:hypothetical protein
MRSDGGAGVLEGLLDALLRRYAALIVYSAAYSGRDYRGSCQTTRAVQPKSWHFEEE